MKNEKDRETERLGGNGAQGRNWTTDTRIFSPLLMRYGSRLLFCFSRL